MLGDFQNQSVGVALDLQRVQNRGEPFLELHVDNGTNDLGNLPDPGDAGGSASLLLSLFGLGRSLCLGFSSKAYFQKWEPRGRLERWSADGRAEWNNIYI